MASGSSRRSSLIERASAVSHVLYISDVRQEICREETLPFDDNLTFEQFKEGVCKVGHTWQVSLMLCDRVCQCTIVVYHSRRLDPHWI